MTKKKEEKDKIISRLKAIDLEMGELSKERAILNKELSKPAIEIPLNQLNLIANLGAKEAKKALGKTWVE